MKRVASLLRRRRPGRTGGDPDWRFLRRVRWQLAALLVGLLFALLMVLGGAVYLTTQQLLRGSLEQTLKSHAQHPPPIFLQALQSDTVVPPNDFFGRHD